MVYIRLWHQDLISKLPRQQLLGQHRECCALRGLGWGKSHNVVNYVFKYPMELLENYHRLIMDEMENRGYNVEPLWKLRGYRGKKITTPMGVPIPKISTKIYNEHNSSYLRECLENLKTKGILLEV